MNILRLLLKRNRYISTIRRGTAAVLQHLINGAKTAEDGLLLACAYLM
jgi:hypothetical protein